VWESAYQRQSPLFFEERKLAVKERNLNWKDEFLKLKKTKEAYPTMFTLGQNKCLTLFLSNDHVILKILTEGTTVYIARAKGCIVMHKNVHTVPQEEVRNLLQFAKIVTQELQKLEEQAEEEQKGK
jgi:hypothetical protein